MLYASDFFSQGCLFCAMLYRVLRRPRSQSSNSCGVFRRSGGSCYRQQWSTPGQQTRTNAGPSLLLQGTARDVTSCNAQQTAFTLPAPSVVVVTWRRIPCTYALVPPEFFAYDCLLASKQTQADCRRTRTHGLRQ